MVGPFAVGLDSFALRQFDAAGSTGGTVIPDVAPLEFLERVQSIISTSNPAVHDGYAPFCKHLFLKNFTAAVPSSMPLDDNTLHFIQTGYISRRTEELPVLSRWVSKDKVKHLLKPAKFLDLILYSKEQIAKESAAMPPGTTVQPSLNASAPYSIISIKAQDVDEELPMVPITMMRNALISEGGSGVAIDRKAYSWGMQTM
eukprot:Lankesteria_metandrocarpae@DN573_c0_g1_i1.p1